MVSSLQRFTLPDSTTKGSSRIEYVTLDIPPPIPVVRDFSLNEARRYALNAVANGPADRLVQAFETITYKYPRAFKQILVAISDSENITEEIGLALRSHWITTGFRTRAAIRDDAIHIRAFRRALAPYSGEELVLYRGEQSSAIDSGKLGLNWSSNREAASQFARGLCTTYGYDGVLLTAVAPPEAIISGPTERSIRLREWEHIVEPDKLLNIQEIGRWPPS